MGNLFIGRMLLKAGADPGVDIIKYEMKLHEFK
jgi:hypothetical protein